MSLWGYPSFMVDRISNEELEAALAEAVDENGVDQRLAAAVSAMTEEQRHKSEENLRRSIAEARRTIRRHDDRTRV